MAVKTRKETTPLAIALDFAAKIRAGKSHELETKWLALGIESVEGIGTAMAFSGRKAVLAKYRG